MCVTYCDDGFSTFISYWKNMLFPLGIFPVSRNVRKRRKQIGIPRDPIYIFFDVVDLNPIPEAEDVVEVLNCCLVGPSDCRRAVIRSSLEGRPMAGDDSDSDSDSDDDDNNNSFSSC